MIKASTNHHKRRGIRTVSFKLRSFRLGRNFSGRRFSMTEAAVLLLLAYLASRGLGAVRQILFNALFSTGPAATAYYAAFRLPDTIFNLIAGGALTHAFIPVLFSHEKDHGDNEVWRLCSLVFNVLFVILIVAILIAEWFAPVFVNNLLVPGLPPAEQQLTTTLTRIMLIQPLILGLGSVATAILHSKRQFFPSALALLFYELGPIAGLLMAHTFHGVGIYGPTFGLLLSALAQIAIQIPNILKLRVKYTFIWNLKYPGLRDIMRLLAPNLLNVIIASIGATFVISFASYLPDKASIAAMHNAYLLFSIPLALVTQSLVSSLLPQLTLQATYRHYVRLSWTIIKIVGGVGIFSLLAAILLYFLGKPAIHILFQYAAASQHASTLTNLALLGYAVGLPGQTLTLLLVLAFYACKDAKTPLFINIGALGVQIGLGYLLVKVLTGTNAILSQPLAASLSATVQALALGLILYLRLRPKVQVDKGLLRLRQRRRHISAIQQPIPLQQSVPQHLFDPFSPAPAMSQAPAPYQQAAAQDQPNWQYQQYQPVAFADAMSIYDTPTQRQPAAQYQLAAEHYQTPAQFKRIGQSQPLLEYAQLSPSQADYQPETEPHLVVEYQRMVLLDPGNLMGLVSWHIAMLTSSTNTDRATTLAVLTRIWRQLGDEQQHNKDIVLHRYSEAAAAQPDNADLQFALGQLYQRTGFYAKAIAAYMLALRNDAVEIMARFAMAESLLAQNTLEAAIQQLEQALQSVNNTAATPIDPGVWTARPHAKGEEHQAPAVEISLLLAKASSPTTQPVETQSFLPPFNQMLLPQEVTSSSRVEVPVLQTYSDEDIQVAIDKARDYRSKQMIEPAFGLLRKIVMVAPKDARPHGELADIYTTLGYLNEAIAELHILADLALERNQLPEAATSMRRIGAIHAQVGDTEEALFYLGKAVELQPDDVGLLREVVSFCQGAALKKEAIHYQSLIAYHYFNTDQIAEATTALQQLIAIDSDNYEAHDLLYQVYQSTNEHELASRVYEHMAHIQSRQAVTHQFFRPAWQ